MRSYSKAVVILCFALGAAFAATPNEEKPKGELDGTYQAIKLINNGKAAPKETADACKAVFAGEDWTVTLSDKSFPAKIKLDAKAKPAQIDISPSDGPEKGKTFLGIYKMENDELVIAFREKGDRPSEFKDLPDVSLIYLKKQMKK